MNRALVALLAALFAGGVAAAPVKALLPAYVESVLRQPPLLTSTLLAIQLGCGGLFALAGGAVSDHFALAGGAVSDHLSRRAAVLAGMTTALFGALLFVARAPALLVAVAVLWGVAGGFQSAGGQSFLIAAVSRARLGSATAIYFVSSTASGALGAYVAGRAADRFGFAAVAAGAAGLALFSLGLAMLFLPPLGTDRAARPAGAPGWRALTIDSYAGLVRRADVLALGALRYFPTVAWGAASLAIPLLVFRLSGTKSAVGLYSMVSLLAASAAQLATGRQIDRLSQRGGPRRLVPPLTLAILCSATAAALASRHLAGLFVAGTAWAMSAWGLSTTMPPLIHELGAGRDDGRLVALMHLLWSAGMLSGTLAAGVLVDLHPAAPFVLAAGCLAVSLAVGVRFARPAAAPAPAVVAIEAPAP